MSSLSSQALRVSPATVSFTPYHFPVSTLPGRVANRFFVTADLLDGVLCVALTAIVQLAIVLRIHVVEHDDKTIRSAVLASVTLDGVVVGGDNVVADGQRSLF